MDQGDGYYLVNGYLESEWVDVTMSKNRHYPL